MADLDKRHLLKSAYNYTQAGQWERALEEYRKVTVAFPDDPNIHSMVADLLAKKGDQAGAARAHVEAARLYRALGSEEKELAALRKALRVQAGNTEATTAFREALGRTLTQAQASMSAGQLDKAEALASRLLDADPANLAASRLLDDVKAARIASEARQAMDEEAAAVPPASAQPDAASEVLARLEGAVQGYLATEDFDNAIETLMVMLKLDPGRVSLQVQLAEAQAQLFQKQQAQTKWTELQNAQRSQVVEEAKEVARDTDLAAWRDEEEAMRRRLEEEQRFAEEQARQELAIVEAAVRELQRSRSAGPTPAAVTAASALDGAEQEAHLKALLDDREALQRRLEEETAAGERRAAEEAQARARAAEMQEHAQEQARQEAQAQAQAVALKALEERLERERDEQRKEFEAERARLQAQEQALQTQLKEMMRTEMARLQAEAREQALLELQQRLQVEQERRQALESEAERKARLAEEAAQSQRRAVEDERRRAEDAARSEKEAVEALRRQEEDRKQAMLAEAISRRAARQAGAGEARSAVLKNSRRISDVLHAATTKHLDQDTEAQLETVRHYLKQDLLLDALRICQKIAEKEPDNEKVKALLKVISERKGL
jgi:hypothetical protein